MKNTFVSKPLLVLAAIAVIGIIACASTPAATSAPDDLDEAIREASDYLNGHVPNGSKIVFLNIESDSTALSEYIIDRLIGNAISDRTFSVVDRAQLDAIRAEQQFQLSGEVNDETALAIGNFVGAQTIVSGGVTQLGSRYSLRIRALEVQTARVQGQYNRNLNAGETITALMRGGRAAPAAAGAHPAQTAQPQAAALPSPDGPFNIGDRGPAGGIIFFDRGNHDAGWRYLEAAPTDIGRLFRDIRDQINYSDTRERGVGWGKRNTEAIMAEAVRFGGGFNWAAQACVAFSLNGFNDWFLPSLDELSFMYGNLHMRGLGGFRNETYWSSTLGGSSIGYPIFAFVNFSDGVQRHDNSPNVERRVRPIRQF
jgi:hypothetical protein